MLLSTGSSPSTLIFVFLHRPGSTSSVLTRLTRSSNAIVLVFEVTYKMVDAWFDDQLGSFFGSNYVNLKNCHSLAFSLARHLARKSPQKFNCCSILPQSTIFFTLNDDFWVDGNFSFFSEKNQGNNGVITEKTKFFLFFFGFFRFRRRYFPPLGVGCVFSA